MILVIMSVSSFDTAIILYVDQTFQYVHRDNMNLRNNMCSLSNITYKISFLWSISNAVINIFPIKI